MKKKSKNTDSEIMEKFLDKVESITQALGITVYYDQEYVLPIKDGGLRGNCRQVTSREELKSVFDGRFISLGEDFTKEMILQCINDTELKEFFYKSPYLAGNLGLAGLVDLLKERKESPEDMLELTTRATAITDIDDPDVIEDFVSILMSDYPEPENRQALATYFFKQKENGAFNSSVNYKNKVLSKNQFHDVLLQLLKTYITDENLTDFNFSPSVKHYLKTKNVQLLNQIVPEKTLIFNLVPEDFSGYMAIPDFLATDARSWLKQLPELLEKHGKQYGINSVDMVLSQSCKLYINLDNQNLINEQSFKQQMHSLVEYLKERQQAKTIEKDTDAYLKSYWLKKSIEQNLDVSDNKENDNQNDMAIQKMKI